MLLLETDLVMPKLFIIGSRGIPAQYGGFETFVEKTSLGLVQKGLKVYVTCHGESSVYDSYHGVNRLIIKRSDNKLLYRFLNDYRAIKASMTNADKDDIFYFLGAAFLPIFYLILFPYFKKKRIKIWLNPDGFGWKRKKFPWWARLYSRIGTNVSLFFSNSIIFDSSAVKKFWLSKHPFLDDKSNVIEYGATVNEATKTQKSELDKFLESNNLKKYKYYLIVARYAPENNFDLIIEQYLKSDLKKPFLIVSTGEPKDMYKKYGIYDDYKLKFHKPIYNQALVGLLRKYCFCYIHGHEVGGTNPTLLEAMASGCLIVAHDNEFNREVLGKNGIYFDKTDGSLIKAFKRVERLSENERDELKREYVGRIVNYYNWERIIDEYYKLLLKTNIN